MSENYEVTVYSKNTFRTIPLHNRLTILLSFGSSLLGGGISSSFSFSIPVIGARNKALDLRIPLAMPNFSSIFFFSSFSLISTEPLVDHCLILWAGHRTIHFPNYGHKKLKVVKMYLIYWTSDYLSKMNTFWIQSSPRSKKWKLSCAWPALRIKRQPNLW